MLVPNVALDIPFEAGGAAYGSVTGTDIADPGTPATGGLAPVA
jgi:hypothetical protein